jgi:hypothetical protein
MHRTCGTTECLGKKALKELEKIKKKERYKKFKEKQKFKEQDRGYWKKRAIESFNAYIRERDKNLPCISCGITFGQFHAGHYRPAGRNEGLRFNVFNVNKQCSQCNNVKSGNLINYRIGLINKYGTEIVECLESQNKIVKFDLEYYKRVHDIFKRKSKKNLKG